MRALAARPVNTLVFKDNFVPALRLLRSLLFFNWFVPRFYVCLRIVYYICTRIISFSLHFILVWLTELSCFLLLEQVAFVHAINFCISTGLLDLEIIFCSLSSLSKKHCIVCICKHIIQNTMFLPEETTDAIIGVQSFNSWFTWT